MTRGAHVNWPAVGFAGLLFGASLVGLGVLGVLRAAPTRAWPATGGVVVASAVEAGTGRSGGDRPRVAYAYTVAGRAYTGHEIGRAMGYTRAGARRWVAQFPVGARVPVYYDPAAPERAVLVPGGVGRAAALLAAGLAGLALWRWAASRARGR